MTWHEIEVIGHPNRSAIEHSARNPGVTIELELPADLPPFTAELSGMWFLELSITGYESTPEGDLVDSPDEPMNSVCFTGIITGTAIHVRLIFFGEVLDRFLVEP